MSDTVLMLLVALSFVVGLGLPLYGIWEAYK